MKKMAQKGWYVWVLALVLLVFTLVNLCASTAGRRFALTLDLTENRLYQLSDTTRKVVAELPAATTVHVFAAREEYPAMYREILSRYEKLSPLLKVVYSDPSENPLLLSHYQQLGLTVSTADMVVEGGVRNRAIAYQDLLLYDGQESTGIDIEQQLTAALLYANSAEAARTFFVTGHGERSSEALQNLFSSNAFQTGNCVLGIDPLMDAALVVLSGPAHDYTDRELEALSTYLEAGGNLMAFLPPSVNPLPNLNAFLADWGLGLAENILFEEKAYAGGSPHNLIPMYQSHPINEYFVRNPLYVVMPSSRALVLQPEEAPGARVFPVLSSTPDAYAKTDLAFASAARDRDDEAGPFPLVALSERTFGAEEDEPVIGKVLLLGSSLMTADDLMRMSNYANRLFLLQSLNFLWPQQESISIPPKSLILSPIAVTRRQALTLGLALAALQPILVLGVGIGVALKRRRL